MDKKQAEQELKEKAKNQQRAAGKLTGMSGRDLFAFAPDTVMGDDEVRIVFLVFYLVGSTFRGTMAEIRMHVHRRKMTMNGIFNDTSMLWIEMHVKSMKKRLQRLKLRVIRMMMMMMGVILEMVMSRMLRKVWQRLRSSHVTCFCLL